MKFLTLIFSLLALPPSALSYEIVAHRGVHQTYPREGLQNDTCTATRIFPPTHEFLENTLPSMQKAFELGATMVEFDIHPTTEGDGKPDQLAVFHDWTLDCRTDARCENGCVTHEQSMSYLKTLDLGYGYTADGGKTFPFRGKFKGMMPTLQEVVNLLYKYPDKKLLVHVKDRFERTHEASLRIMAEYPVEIRRRVYMEHDPKFRAEYERLEIPEAIYQASKPSKDCLKKYVLLGFAGYVPEACRGLKLFIPLHETLERFAPGPLKGLKGTTLIWGWPEKFIERFHEHGSQVYAWQVDSEEDYREMQKLPLDGIMTNRIELIGPLRRRSGAE